MVIVNKFLDGGDMMDNKVFMDFVDEECTKSLFDVNSFITGLGDLNYLFAFDILDKMNDLKTEDRKQVLANEKIRNKLRYSLLFESKDNQWYYYRKVLEVITPSEFLSLYNCEYLSNYFISSIYKEEKYKFYAALCEKDINDVVRYVLNDKELYEDFFKYDDGVNNPFDKLEYDLFKEVILKMQNEEYALVSYFLKSIKEEYQYNILNEPMINEDTLAFLLSSFNNSVNSHFFENDLRAVYLYDRFDINRLVKNGVKFNDNILCKNEFFEFLKNESFIVFRNNINIIEKNNNPLLIEEHLGKYYDEILNCYDRANGLFDVYQLVLDNPGSTSSKSYIFDEDIACRINHHLRKDNSGNLYYYDIDDLIRFLKDETSRKISEVVVDALFRDNIYNVWLNIKEMLRYNNLLDEGSKILDNDKCRFYETILDFDNIDNDIKIELYNNLKDKNFSLEFYSDLRKIKDISYDRIKDNLFNFTLHSDYVDKESTDKFGVTVYDLRDKEYTMLVRTQDDFREIGHYKRGCYSIISNENNQVFGEYDYSSFLYGYNSFENDRILHMFERDSYSSNFRDEPSRFVNRIMTSDQLVKASDSYSEVQIVNIKSDKKYRWYAKRPDFIVVFNMVGDKHVKESKRLGIPIVVISKKKLDKKDVIDVNYDIDVDAYVKDIVGEREHRIRRLQKRGV